MVCDAAHSSASQWLTDTREHAANEVLVTGTFDDWQKTVTLEKVDGVFKKTVELPKVHTQYKVRTCRCGRLAAALVRKTC
jgi:SpoVK/Ycf46/Vps4 family AAA+-type ATPase